MTYLVLVWLWSAAGDSARQHTIFFPTRKFVCMCVSAIKLRMCDASVSLCPSLPYYLSLCLFLSLTVRLTAALLQQHLIITNHTNPQPSRPFCRWSVNSTSRSFTNCQQERYLFFASRPSIASNLYFSNIYYQSSLFVSPSNHISSTTTTTSSSSCLSSFSSSNFPGSSQHTSDHGPRESRLTPLTSLQPPRYAC